MAKLSIIRHGQASFHGANYDQLSPLGERQAYLLGQWYTQLGIKWDRVLMGPKRRHQQTYEQVAVAYGKAGMQLPEPELEPDFDEHQGPGVVKKVLSNGANGEPSDAILPKNIKSEAAIKMYFEKFQEITLKWISGELVEPNFESWQDFRARIDRGLEKAMQPGAKSVAVFTSGGPVAATAGTALNLPDSTVLEMSWNVNNIASSEFLFSKGRFSMCGFNTLPQLGDPKMITLV